jgi:hypothetical protein
MGARQVDLWVVVRQAADANQQDLSLVDVGNLECLEARTNAAHLVLGRVDFGVVLAASGGHNWASLVDVRILEHFLGFQLYFLQSATESGATALLIFQKVGALRLMIIVNFPVRWAAAIENGAA